MSDKTGLLDLLAIMQEELCVKTEQTAAIKRQKDRLFKKARVRVQGVDTKSKAIRDFLDVNDRVALVRVTANPELVNTARAFISSKFREYNKLHDAECLQDEFLPSLAWSNWRYGPGASNGVVGTHTADKIGQPMTCTAPARSLVVKLRSENAYFTGYSTSECDGTSVVKGSKLATVPKNHETDRTIGIEPSGNMALQLSLGSYVENVLRYIGLDIRHQQPKNRELARLGSIYGNLCTIDLKSASDLISIELCKLLLPRELFRAMLYSRSEHVEIPACTGQDAKTIPLNMMSTMGNGFTFPVMTLIFLALIYAFRRCAGTTGNNRIDWSCTAVFGDDIIIKTSEYTPFVEVLQQCGLVVNLDKSYSSGTFRESCGGDFDAGIDITPIYIKSLATQSASYVAINQVLRWCSRERCLLPRTIAFLVDKLRSFGKIHVVPEWMSDSEGLRCRDVPRNFTYLKLVQHRVKLRDERYLMMLACGGYVNTQEADVYYVPRTAKPRFVVRKSRLPRGYLDGRCGSNYNDLESLYISSYQIFWSM